MNQPYPGVRDWTMAVQLPATRFRGSPLSGLTAQKRPGGLVQVERGTFCYTFKVLLQGRVQALRCPHMPASNREDRLEALARFFQTHPCPHVVPFQVHRHAAHLPGYGQAFSVLSMDWVEGQALDDWFDAHLGDAPALQAMADRWRGLMRVLQGLGIAHGDLPHGNNLIRAGKPVLVDYDAFYAPATGGWPSDEVGHPNYAHPGRTAADYGPHLDAFPGLSIYLSLLAAARLPALARQLTQAGRLDKLVLSRQDYENPAASARLQQMLVAPDPQVARLAAQLRDMCLAEPGSIRYDWTRFALTCIASSPHVPAWLRQHPRIRTSGAGRKQLVVANRPPFLAALTFLLFAVLLLLVCASPMTTGALYLASLERAIVNGRPSVTLPAWNADQEAFLASLCNGYRQGLGLDVQLTDTPSGSGVPLPLRTLSLPDPSAAGALRLQATGERELLEALTLLPRFTGDEAYILYTPAAGDAADGLEEHLTSVLTPYAGTAVNPFGKPFASLSMRLFPSLRLALAPLSDAGASVAPAAQASPEEARGWISATFARKVNVVAGNAVWLHLRYRFAPSSDAERLRILDEAARAESSTQTDSEDSFHSTVWKRMPMLRRSIRSLRALQGLDRLHLTDSSGLLSRSSSMIPARRTLEAVGALVVYDSQTREMHWVLHGIHRSMGVDQDLLRQNGEILRLSQPARLIHNLLWLPREALSGGAG